MPSPCNACFRGRSPIVVLAHWLTVKRLLGDAQFISALDDVLFQAETME
jgi:hypothetical protein